MNIEQNYDLTKLNTFGVSARAKFFIELNNEFDLKELFLSPIFKNNEKLFLGGGSNILFTKDFDGIIVLNKIKNIEIIEEQIDYVLLRAMGGELWHDLVLFAVNNGYWGIENLTLVPGTVGAAPIQNIGAYGVELKDTLENVEVFDITTGDKKVFKKEECEFGYRDSVFKNKLKGRYFIFSITLKLSKIPKRNVTYKVLQDYLENLSAQAGNKIETKSLKDISDAVANIRRSKLPDPKIIGNAGSFFKNVFTTKEKVQSLLEEFTDMPYFEEDHFMKIPSGWLIEQCGWKGKSVGNVGVHDKQALVLVNHGGASGEEIKNLAEQIIKSVYEKFGLKLIPEVNLI